MSAGSDKSGSSVPTVDRTWLQRAAARCFSWWGLLALVLSVGAASLGGIWLQQFAVRRVIADIESRGGIVEHGYQGAKLDGQLSEVIGRETIDQPLRGFRSVERVRLVQPTCSDDDLRALGRFPELRSLVMVRNAVTEEGLLLLRQNRNLRHLVAQDVPVGASLSVVGEMTELEALVVVRGHLGDDDLASLGACGALRHINLNHNRLTSRSGEHLGKVASLESISLTGCGVDEEILPQLMRLPNLKHLLLNKTQVRRLAISEAGEFRSLVTLDLCDTPLEEIDPAVWAKFPKLTTLEVANTPLTAGPLHSIERIKTLGAICASPRQIDSALIEAFGKMPRLHFIHVEASSEEQPGEAMALANRLRTVLPNPGSYAARRDQRSNPQSILDLGATRYVNLETYLEPPARERQ